MTLSLPWIYAFNLIVNSFLSFLTISLLVLSLTYFLRIKIFRLKSLILFLPFLKLLLDPFLYDFDKWALASKINILGAPEGSRTLGATFCYPTSIENIFSLNSAIGLSINEANTFTPADVLVYLLPSPLIKFSVLFACFMSCFLLSIYLFKIKKSLIDLSNVVAQSKPYKKEIQNKTLAHFIMQTGCQIMISNEVSIPCAFGIIKKVICLPSCLLKTLSVEECEAVIAHEILHLRWYDGLARAFFQAVCALFWWIPTSWLLRKLENAQEIASDVDTMRLNTSITDLASAIVKIASKDRFEKKTVTLATHFIDRNFLKNRISLHLTEHKKPSKILVYLQCCIISIIMQSLLFGKFWIF